mgnify:CR=1 FL=1
MAGKIPRRAAWLLCVIAAGAIATAAAADTKPAVSASTTQSAVLFLALNVADLDRSLDFYTRVIGMKETQRFDARTPTEPVEVVLRFDATSTGAFLLLSHSPTRQLAERADSRKEFGRLALSVPAVAPLVERVRRAGYQVSIPPKAVPEAGVVIAMVTDPDGYTVEFIEFTSAAGAPGESS